MELRDTKDTPKKLEPLPHAVEEDSDEDDDEVDDEDDDESSTSARSLDANSNQRTKSTGLHQNQIDNDSASSDGVDDSDERVVYNTNGNGDHDDDNDDDDDDDDDDNDDDDELMAAIEAGAAAAARRTDRLGFDVASQSDNSSAWSATLAASSDHNATASQLTPSSGDHQSINVVARVLATSVESLASPSIDNSSVRLVAEEKSAWTLANERVRETALALNVARDDAAKADGVVQQVQAKIERARRQFELEMAELQSHLDKAKEEQIEMRCNLQARKLDMEQAELELQATDEPSPPIPAAQKRRKLEDLDWQP